MTIITDQAKVIQVVSITQNVSTLLRSLFTTCTNPIIHLFYSPNVFDVSWDIFIANNGYANLFFFWGGGGVIEVYYGIAQVVDVKIFPFTSYYHSPDQI